MILRLVWENVRYRPIRTLLSILLIGVSVSLILVIQGISQGFIEGSKKRYEGTGADVLFKSRGSSLLSFSAASLPEKLVGVLEKEPHVVLATGTVTQPIGGWDSMTGIDLASFGKMSGGLIILHGRSFEGPDDILIDTYYADQRHIQAGATISILQRNWHVAGVVESGKLAHIFVPIKRLQDLYGSTGYVSQIYLKLDDSKNADQVTDALKAKYGDYPIYPMKVLESYLSVDSIPLVSVFVNVVIGIVTFVGFIVVCLSMYMAVLQRTREIGILKSLGATKVLVMELILAEALLLGFGGTVAGIALSFVSRAVLQRVAPATLPQAIVPGWWPIAAGIALGAAILGAVYPGMLAVRQDPIEALAYE